MAYIYIREDSRRVSKIPDDEMESRWQAAFGPKKKQTCSRCKLETPITKDGLCDECIRKTTILSCPDILDESACVMCLGKGNPLNALGLCDSCRAMAQEDYGDGK